MAKKSKEKSANPIQEYLDEISTYERDFKKWETRVEKILKRYRDEQRDKDADSQCKFNILWSNVQTLVPACFSKIPQPDVSRRFRDQDPVGRVASLILERALEFEVQHYKDYVTTMKQSVMDRFLGGRGTAWVRYEPHFKEAEVQITEDVENDQVTEQLDYECVPVDYVHWRDFGHSVARTWEEVNKVWRIVYMNEDSVKERFGEEIAKKLPYDSSPEDLKRKESETEVKKQARVYEIWDKEKAKAVWISKSYKDFLDEKEDPLGLQDFFPCPKPLFATTTNESLIPVPDFTLYQDQANELDILADRIDGLTKMLQLKGVYDASADSAVGRLFTEGNNGTLIPVQNWTAFAEKNGLKGQIDTLDLMPLVKALETAQNGMEQVKNQVYEITGISDIIRGNTAASETATAQQIKGQYASLRLRTMQETVARYATEILQLKAQVMCKKFNPRTLISISAAEQLHQNDQQFIVPAMQLLMGQERLVDPDADSPNPLRAFRIEVAADTLVQLDEQQEKTDRMEMLQAFGTYIEKFAEIGNAVPIMVPLMVEVGKYALSSFKIGKSIEGAFDTALDQLKAQTAQKMANPQPSPEQVKAQVEQQKGQIAIAVKTKEAELDERKMQMEEQHDVRDMQIKGQQQQQKAMFDQQKMMRNEQASQLQHQQKMREAMMPKPQTSTG